MVRDQYAVLLLQSQVNIVLSFGSRKIEADLNPHTELPHKISAGMNTTLQVCVIDSPVHWQIQDMRL